MTIDKFCYGSVLKVTREDTLADIERNFLIMKECGFDTTVIWPSSFWWEEKTEEYPFRTGKEILRIAERVGMNIIMELAGQLTVQEYIPDFLMKDEYYATDLYGHRDPGQAGFGFLSYFHPEVNALICEHFEKTATAYKDFPALVGYDVFNETMFRCFDKYTINEFRKWLTRKYGTIEKLNQVWERTYTDFSQIDYQSWKWMSVMSEVDYAQFRKDSISLFLKNWCDAVLKADNTHPLIADNIGSMVNRNHEYGRPQDDYALKELADEIGMSFYPKQVYGCEEPAQRWLTFEGYFDASKRQGFMISEMQTHIQTLFNPTTVVHPHELKQWCLEGIAGGAKALVFWMWRPFNKGLQTLGRGIVDYKERPTPRFDVACEIKKIIDEIGTVKPKKARVAIVYEPICDDFQRSYTKGYGDTVDQKIYLSSILGVYKAMFDCNIPCDIIRLSEIEDYEAIIFTNHIVLDKKDGDRIAEFVKNGGKVVIDGKFGIVDSESMLHKNIPGGDFSKIIGTDYIDTDYLSLDFNYNGENVRGYYGRDIMALLGAKADAAFSDGTPAVVTNKVGNGSVTSINTYLYYGHATKADESVVRFTRSLFEKLGIQSISDNRFVKLRLCENKDGDVLFLFNYSDEEQSVSYGGKNYTLKPQEVGVYKI